MAGNKPPFDWTGFATSRLSAPNFISQAEHARRESSKRVQWIASEREDAIVAAAAVKYFGSPTAVLERCLRFKPEHLETVRREGVTTSETIWWAVTKDEICIQLVTITVTYVHDEVCIEFSSHVGPIDA